MSKRLTMVAIETRYVGPTNYKPGRIIATTHINNQKLIVSWDRATRGAKESGLNDPDNQRAPHQFVATELANEFGWLNDGTRLYGGSTKAGYCFVFVDPERVQPRKLWLVYQAGIANVFEVSGDEFRKRLLQSDFRTCESFCLGAEAVGAEIYAACCNRAGDIISMSWDTRPDEAPFSDNFRGKWQWFKAAGFRFSKTTF